jgi:hypothetical protein
MIRLAANDSPPIDDKLLTRLIADDAAEGSRKTRAPSAACLSHATLQAHRTSLRLPDLDRLCNADESAEVSTSRPISGNMRSLDESSADEFEHFARGLLGRATGKAEADMGANFDPRLLDSIDLAHHDEGLIGLENLCSNLHDFEITVTDDERTALLVFADVWDLGDRDRRLVGLPERR